MTKWTSKACEEIDAALFSGDEFFNPECVKELELYLGRWQRKLVEFKELTEEVKGDSEAYDQ